MKNKYRIKIFEDGDGKTYTPQVKERWYYTWCDFRCPILLADNTYTTKVIEDAEAVISVHRKKYSKKETSFKYIA